MKFIKLYTDELKNKGLSLFDKAVYGSLQTKYQYHGNQEFYTFESYIADELEISERTVKRSIKKLNETGLISITKRYHKQLKQVVNYYNLDIQETADNMRETDAITDVITADKKKEFIKNFEARGLKVSALCGDLGKGFTNPEENPFLIEKSITCLKSVPHKSLAKNKFDSRNVCNNLLIVGLLNLHN